MWRIKAKYSNDGRYTFVYLEFHRSFGKFFIAWCDFLYTIIIILISVKGDKDMKNYVTLTALGNYIDIKELTVGEKLILEKDKKINMMMKLSK